MTATRTTTTATRRPHSRRPSKAARTRVAATGLAVAAALVSDDRPSVLVTAATETVSAYAAAGGQGIRLKFQPPTIETARVTLVTQNPNIGKNNDDGTSAAPPLQVKATITNGLHSTATYTLTGNA